VRQALALLLLVTGAAAAAAVPVASLAIASPADVSDLVPVVEVRGTAAEPGGSVTWSIMGTDRAGQESVAADGSFAFSIPTDGLHLTQIVRIVARGARGAYAERVLLLVDRDPGPVLSLAPPADGAPDALGISVSGRVANPAGGPIEGWLEALSWSIPALVRGGAMAVDRTGAFATTIDVPGGMGPVTLWLRAEDRFGHLTLAAIRLDLPRATAPAIAAAPAAEALPADAAGSRIEITAPEGTGWYRSRLSVEGRVVGVSPPPEMLAWSVSGDGAPAGEILVDSDGTFRLELATGGLTGDRTLSLAGADGALGARVVLRDARRAPEVGITAPGTGGQYAAQLRLAGTVTDPYAGDPLMGGYASVSWQMSPLGAASPEPDRSGPIEVAADGTFAAIVSTAGVTGQQVVSVVAVGRSGNTGRAALSVTRGESDVSSFTAVAGDGIVTLRWDTETADAGYDLRFAIDRPIDDGASAVTDVKPPCVLRGIPNGSRCVVRLRVRRPGEPDAWSADREALPLSPDTLRPDVIGEYRGIRLSWRRIPGAASFEVQRSARADAGWEVVATGLASPGWLDETASAGLTWYYRVRPEVATAVASGAASGTALAFTARALESAGALALPGGRAVAVSGDYAWVCGDDGVHVVDLAEPDAPRGVAMVGMGDALAVDVAGVLAAVVDRERGLVMLDVTEPRAPREIGVRFVPDARAVALSSDMAYVACGPNGVRLLDVSDPRSPERLVTIASPDARAICRHEGRLLVADAQAGLRVFDLSVPAAPRPVADLAIPGARAVSARGARAIVVGARGVSIVDLGDPTRPTLLTIVAPGATCAAVSVDGNAVVAGAEGVVVLDAADPAGRPIDTMAVSGAEALALAGEIACLLAHDQLRCLRLRVLGRPAVVGQAAVPVSAGRIASTGGRVFVAARSSGMLVFDVIADGERRELRPALLIEARFAEDAAFAGASAFVADGAAGLRIFTLEGTAAGAGTAREVARFQPSAAVHGVSVSGSLAVVAAGAAGVVVLDVADPAVPRQLAAIASPDARDVALEGTFLLVADAAAGLRSFDLSLPSRPVENAPALPPAVRVSSGKGWALAVGPGGVTIIDRAGDGIPRVAGFHPTAWAEDAVRVGDRLIVAEGHQGLVVLDLVDPAHPRAIAALRDVHASAVAAGEGYVLAAGAGSVAAFKVLVPPWLESR
jgi:hypothetical protein